MNTIQLHIKNNEVIVGISSKMSPEIIFLERIDLEIVTNKLSPLAYSVHDVT